MKRASRQLDRGAIELIEEAVHLLRRAPISNVALYYAGALPFVLALLYFWADMSRSPSADQHLAGGALGLGLLFVWMKFCQSIFAGRLRSLMTGELPARLAFHRCRRILISQATLQSTGLFLLPLALILTLPFAWVYAFYQNLAALDDGETAHIGGLVKEAQQQALLEPKQNHLLLAIFSGFGLFVFLNWSMLGLLLPAMLKTLFGVESLYSRSVFSLLNTTFFAVMFGLTYLSVDPILKAAYALRCFYGQARQSGEDLKTELRQHRLAGAVSVAGLALALILIPQIHVTGAEAEQTTQDSSGRPEKQVAPGNPSSVELDRNIQQVLKQQKYTWRMPREKLDRPETNGLFERFFERVRLWLRSLRDWVIEWLRRLFHRRATSGSGASSGYGWIFTLQLLLYALIAIVLAALVILIYRILRGRHGKTVVVTSEAIQPAPDLNDDAVGADQLPEDGWSNLGRELLERGELRLALRAFYLASLAHLASRKLIGLAKFKSNRDYERELGRRGHSFPDLLSLFADNVMVFDSIWYGRHDIDSDLLQKFVNRVEQIRARQV